MTTEREAKDIIFKTMRKIKWKIGILSVSLQDPWNYINHS